MFSQYFSKEEVQEQLDKVIHDLSVAGLYAPMLRRMKVRIDDSRPEVMKRMMDRGESPMCTDGQTIGVSMKNLHRIVNEAKTLWLKSHPDHYYTNELYQEIRNIFIHELTHAICRHSNQGMKIFSERYQKSHQKTLNKELACWNIACEIEANRGYGIESLNSPVYDIGVTDDKYPEAKDARYLLDIFHKVLDNYEDQVAKDMEAIKNALEEALKDDSKGDKSKDGKGDKSEQTSGQDEQPANADSEGSESEEGSPSTSESGNQKGGSKETPKLGDTEEEQSRREALMNLIKETMSEGEEGDSEEGFKPEMFDPDAPRNHETVFTEHGNSYSHGGDDIDGNFDASGREPYSLLDEMFDDWKQENLKRAMAKLKGTVTGAVSRNRVATYSRQARRDTSDGLLKKGHKRERRSSPKILLALDKSGSMSQTSTQRATEAVAEIFDTTGRPTEGCWICLHDGGIRMNKPMKQWKSVVQSFYPSGGNDFTAVIKLANKLGVDVVLNVGDGGDYTSRDREAVKTFEKAGRQWYDVSIVNIGRRGAVSDDHERWWKEVYEADAKNGGVRRHFIDLTGYSDFSDALDEVFAKK